MYMKSSGTFEKGICTVYDIFRITEMELQNQGETEGKQ